MIVDASVERHMADGGRGCPPSASCRSMPCWPRRRPDSPGGSASEEPTPCDDSGRV